MSSTSVNVTLRSPSVEDANGIVIKYEMYYEQTEDTSNNGTQIFPATDNTAELHVTDLKKYKNYTLRAAAITSIGKGPFSDPITVMTGEDGKFLYQLFLQLYGNLWLWENVLRGLRFRHLERHIFSFFAYCS